MWESTVQVTRKAPGGPAGLRGPWTVICAGLVPGSPARQPGEARYSILRGPDGRLAAAISVVRELAEGRSVLAQRLDPPHYESRCQLAEAPGGTRLELTMCWPDAPVTDAGEELRAGIVASVQQTAAAYQAALEGTG